MNNRPPHFDRFIGVDVGKLTCSIHDSLQGETWSCPNTRKDLKACFSRLKRKHPTGILVICEATGGYEALLLDVLLALDLPAHRADAGKVKAFIRSFGTRGKSDPLDARALSRYGKERHDHLALYSLPPEEFKAFSALARRRKELVDMRVQELNRSQAPDMDAFVLKSVKASLRNLNRLIKQTESRMAQLIEQCDALKQRFDTLTGVTGIGARTAEVLLCDMPRLGTLSGKQAASLAGLAPHPKESGQATGYRRTQGGRPDLKKALFIAAWSASRYHPTLKLFYQKLLAKGKKPIVALVAVARRLIVILNAKLRDLSLLQPV